MSELTQTKAPADDCMKQHMAELKDKHPEMSQEQMVAIAMQKCGQSNKMMQMFMQDEVNYTPVSTARGKACSACRWFCGDHCHIVMGEIAPNGYCDRYEMPPPMEESMPTPVTIVEPEMQGEMSLQHKEAVNEDNLFNRIWQRIQDVVNPPQEQSAFTVQKDLKGEWRWVASFTNNFKDRENEIISERALDGYLERVNAGFVPMPELWVGHIEETKHGKADMVFGAGNFVVAVGHFDDNEMGQAALKYYQKHANKTPLSHGFTFPEWGLKQGIYGVANPFEITTLPPPLIPSNPFTDFEVNNMKQITPEQKAALALVFGAEKADAIVKTREQQSEEIKAAGVAFKDFVELKEEDATAAPAVDTVKPMGELISALIESQGELLSLLTAQGKALKAFQDAQTTKDAETAKQLEAVNTLAEKLQAELKLTPRAASTANETKLSAKEAEEVKKQIDQTEADPFFQI
jgi:hypothetical protein